MGRFVTVNGCSLFIEDLGPQDATAILVFHGGPGMGGHAEPKTSFGPFADRYRVVCCDQRGNGVSELKPPYSHRQWVEDAEALRVTLGLGDKIVVAGGSYGGFLALEYVLAFPEHVRALVLRDTAPDNEHHAAARQNALASARVRVDPVKLERIFAGHCRDDADMRDCYREIQPLYNAHWDPERDAEKLEAIRFHAETHNWAFSRNLPGWDLKPQLHRIQVPTLIVVGRHDWVTPLAASEQLHAGITGSQLEIFEHSGHSPQLEEPARFQAVVRDFLARAEI